MDPGKELKRGGRIKNFDSHDSSDVANNDDEEILGYIMTLMKHLT
jgi:hypothetical protein